MFRRRLDKVEAIGPESFPKIRRAKEYWKHMEIQHVRIDLGVKNLVAGYVVPDWDLSEHMEWVIQGADELIYAGQFVGWPVAGYTKPRKSKRKT